MVQKISASVGRKGKNKPEDVKAIQALLNPFASKVGFGKLKVDGAPSPKLEKAIGQFQLQVCGFKADFRVDPGKNTIKKLNAGPAKMKAEEKKIEKLKEDQKAKMIKAAKDAAMKEAKAKSLDKSAWEQMWSDVESYATELWDSYCAKSEKKGEAPEKAAPKIADKVAKDAKKKAAETVKVIEESAPTYPGRVTGKTTGVNKKIIDVLFAVSSHYKGTTIHVVSGLRNQKGQASAMYNGWNSHLKQGKIYVYLRGNEKLRLELDQYVTNKDKPGFIKHMLKNADFSKISRHLTGNAVDVTTRTEQKIIDALATCLRYLAEKNSEGIKCHHFDNRKLKMPTDAMKAKWKV